MERMAPANAPTGTLSILPEDLEYTPFDSKGGLGGFYRVFGEKYQEILDEMNEELVA